MMEEVGRLNAGVAAFTREQAIPDETVSKLQVVLDEVLTNVAQHADAEFVIIDLWLSESMVRLTITDDGQPFNPLAQAPPDTSLGLHDRQIGGLGIHLVRGLMSEIEYRYVNGQNVLAMTMEV
jgi:serine/threonine-protein kinase RsbW